MASWKMTWKNKTNKSKPFMHISELTAIAANPGAHYGTTVITSSSTSISHSSFRTSEPSRIETVVDWSAIVRKYRSLVGSRTDDIEDHTSQEQSQPLRSSASMPMVSGSTSTFKY